MTHVSKIVGSFARSINEVFAPLMQKKSFQKTVIKDAEDYRDDLDDMSDEEILKRAFDEMYPAWMNDFERRADFDGENVIVYRALSVKSLGDIKYKKLGGYWTWDIEKADNYSNRNTKLSKFILCAKVPASAINISDTLQKIVWPGYDLEDSERELNLRIGAKITIDRILDSKGKNVLEKPMEGTI